MKNNKKNTFVVEIILGAIPATLLMMAFVFFFGVSILIGASLYEIGFLNISGCIFGLLGTFALWRGAFFFLKPVTDQHRVTAYKIAVYLVIGLIPAFILFFSSSSAEADSLLAPFAETFIFMLLGPIAVAFKYLVLIIRFNRLEERNMG